MSEPNREKTPYDDTDRRLMAALHAVKVPTDLRARLERSLQVAPQEPEPLDSPSLVEHAPQIRKPDSSLWKRRNVIAAALAAGLGGIARGYRQLTQPLSKEQLVASIQRLVDQVKSSQWHPLTEAESVTVMRSLQDVGFLKQVWNVQMLGVSELQPPRNMRRATAYKFGSEFVLFDLTIERGVQSVTSSLAELPWSRSDAVAFAMSSEHRTLVFAGPASIRKHILRPQTI